jgi:hypothetical protein
MAVNPRAKGFEQARATKMRQIKMKEKEVRAKDTKILHLADYIRNKSQALKEQNAYSKALRVANARMDQHHEFERIDTQKNPADRSFDIRMYTKMDLDVWKYHEVRDWFNKDATKEDLSYKLRPADTGYVIKTDPGFKEKSHANFDHGDTPRNPPMFRTHLPNNLISMASARPYGEGRS